MKKHIVALLFAIGFSTFSFAQTASSGKGEKGHKHIKSFRPMDSHFDHSTKKDKLLDHNGTVYYTAKHNYVVKNNEFASSKKYKKGKKWNKTKNKLFGTYTLK